MALTEVEDDQTGDESKEPQFGERKSRDRKNRKEKVKPLTKVIIRRLPPSMDEESFLKQIDPLPDNDYFYFVPADWSLGQNATSRAYINFTVQDDVFIFKEKFDGYVFVDTKGAEYPAIVEFAPFQGLPKGKSRKKDNKSNTIELDPHFVSFIEALNNLDNDSTKTELKMEYSYQIKSDKKITTTPLLEFLANKKQERREERRRKIEDKKKQRDDDKSRKKEKNASATTTTFQEEVSRNADDKKRRDRNRKKDVSKAIPSSIPEEDNGDGITVRTIKSRILERGDRNDRDRGKRDRGADSKQQNKCGGGSGGGGGGGDEPSGSSSNRAANKEGEPSERDRKRAERNEQRKAANALKDAARRKEKRLRRNERENNRKDDGPESGVANVDHDKTSVEAAPDKIKGDESKPIQNQDRARKYSESRRERRALRKENYKAEIEAIGQAKDVGSEDKKSRGSQEEDHNHGKENKDVQEKSVVVVNHVGASSTLEQVDVKYQSQTSNEDEEVAKGERRESYDSKQDSSSGGDTSRDTSHAKRERDMKRIRNKDRPSLQIYQPGRRGGKKDDKSGTESIRTVPNSPTEKAKPMFEDKNDVAEGGERSFEINSVSGQEPKPPSADLPLVDEKAAQPTAVKAAEKRVSRYSERRNKIKERFSQRDDGATKQATVDSVENVIGAVEKMKMGAVAADGVTETGPAVSIESIRDSKALPKDDESVRAVAANE